MYYEKTVNFHAVLGLWDIEILGVLEKALVKSGLLPSNGVAADVGGNIGYYSMWLSQFALKDGQIYTFEPSDEILPFLTKNLALNHIENVEVVKMACGNHIGTTDFFLSEHHHSSSIYADWAAEGNGAVRKVTVQVTTLDSFFAPETGRRPPNFIKVDIEGGGTHALPGCRNVLRDARPFVVIESHTVEEDQAISDVLTGLNYCAYRLNDRRWVEKPGATHPDKLGVWGTLLLAPQEKYEALARELKRV
jgi:FkbM family methyltransferase